jgi:hypothetical protein
MTGLEIGEKQKDGSYPEGTINALVKTRLEKMATRLTKFNESKENQSE